MKCVINFDYICLEAKQTFGTEFFSERFQVEVLLVCKLVNMLDAPTFEPKSMVDVYNWTSIEKLLLHRYDVKF